MRVSIVSGTFHPEAGGPPTYLKRLAEGLVEHGHQVRVATFGESSRAADYPYPVERISRLQPIPLRIARLTRLAWRDARNADLIFANDYGLPPLLANLAARKPLVMKIVSDFAWEFGVRHSLVAPDTSIDAFQSARLPAQLELVRRIQSTYALRADAVIVPSEYLRRIVAGWGVPTARVHVLHNAADIASVSARPTRAQLGLTETGQLIVTVARLVPWKGVDTVVRAVAQLRAAGVEVSLVVVGDGEERARLESMALTLGVASNVRFVGEVPHEDVGLYLGIADLFVLASTYEGFSHVLLEALAAGAATVATRVGGNLEVLVDGVNGLLVPPADVPALVSALATLLGDSDFRGRLASAGRQTLVNYSWDSLLSRTEALFCDVAARHSSAEP